eukprot:1146957-Pelagomonas_calceolata.AAC.4
MHMHARMHACRPVFSIFNHSCAPNTVFFSMCSSTSPERFSSNSSSSSSSSGNSSSSENISRSNETGNPGSSCKAAGSDDNMDSKTSSCRLSQHEPHLVMHAARDIASGEAVTVTYMGPQMLQPVDVRRMHLQAMSMRGMHLHTYHKNKAWEGHGSKLYKDHHAMVAIILANPSRCALFVAPVQSPYIIAVPVDWPCSPVASPWLMQANPASWPAMALNADALAAPLRPRSPKKPARPWQHWLGVRNWHKRWEDTRSLS